jgi:hypothetical protein
MTDASHGRLWIDPMKPSGEERARRRFRFDEEGEDAKTFAPFIVTDLGSFDAGEGYSVRLEVEPTSFWQIVDSDLYPLGPEQTSHLVETVIRALDPEMISDGRVRLIPDDVDMFFVSSVDAVRVLRSLVELWKEPRRIYELIENL